MQRARRHQRLFALLALAQLALVAELAGRSLTSRIDIGRHVATPSYGRADYYPFLLLGVKIGIALLLARLAWRFARARSSTLAARRLLTAVGSSPSRAPRLRLELSPRLWALSFAVTSSIFLIQSDAESLSVGRLALLDPWLHSSALPVFAVLSVLVAFLYGAVARWLADYERHAEETVAQARNLARGQSQKARRVPCATSIPPRRLFGLSFESRPPPVPA
jgi:hypothetical protein